MQYIKTDYSHSDRNRFNWEKKISKPSQTTLLFLHKRKCCAKWWQTIMNSRLMNFTDFFCNLRWIMYHHWNNEIDYHLKYSSKLKIISMFEMSNAGVEDKPFFSHHLRVIYCGGISNTKYIFSHIFQLILHKKIRSQN